MIVLSPITGGGEEKEEEEGGISHKDTFNGQQAGNGTDSFHPEEVVVRHYNMPGVPHSRGL